MKKYQNEKNRLSLMHVKCIHELCRLLDHITLYLIVDLSYGHVFH
jgi:hypothetical protein